MLLVLIKQVDVTKCCQMALVSPPGLLKKKTRKQTALVAEAFHLPPDVV